MGFFFQGLTLGLAYVAPIGMQNLFVIDSALTKPRRRALLTALIVLFFDVSLSLSCFFGIGKLMQDHAWLKLAILAIGGLVVIRIGAGLLFPGKGGDDGAAQTPQARACREDCGRGRPDRAGGAGRAGDPSGPDIRLSRGGAVVADRTARRHGAGPVRGQAPQRRDLEAHGSQRHAPLRAEIS